MTSAHAQRFAAVDSDDLDQVLDSLARERKVKLAAVLGGLVALLGSLLAVAYLNFGTEIDPGPARPAPDVHPGQSFP